MPAVMLTTAHAHVVDVIGRPPHARPKGAADHSDPKWLPNTDEGILNLNTHKICELGVGCFYNANDDDNEDNDDGNVDNDNDDNDGAGNDDNGNEGDNDLQLFCVVFAINGNR